jgi:uncharacterized protein (TIGR03067 family)
MRLLAAAAFLALAALTAGAADDAKDAAKKLEGTYEIVALTAGGKPDPEKDEVKAVVIKDGEIVIMGKRDEKAKFTLDPSKKPAHIDIVARGDERILGVYEAKDTDKGLELTIAFEKGGGTARPTDLKGEGERAVVLKLFRKK